MDFYYVLILALAIWDHLGYETNACSVLPGGSPRCFAEDEDDSDAADYQRKRREIDFKIHGQNMMYGFEVDPGMVGDDVRLGENWEETIGHRVDTVLCRRDLSLDAYKPEYQTKMYDYRKSKTFDVIGDTSVESVFVITKKEVWHCAAEEERGQSVTFTRVVTELVSKNELGKVYFFDGTEVIAVPIPSATDTKFNNAIVQEIKYLHTETNKVLKYDGHLQFERVENPDFGVFVRVGEPTSLLVDLTVQDETGYYQRDVIYASEVAQSSGLNRKYPEDGLIFTDDQRPFAEIGQFDDRATCRMLTEDARLYNEASLPFWSYWINPNGYYEPELLAQNDFTKHFIVTRHEIWECTIENKETFLRTVLEYIGKTPMNRIEYFDSNSVWRYRMNEKSKSVAVRAVHYFKDDNLRVTYKYNGMVKLMKEEQGLFAYVKEKFLSTKSGKFIVNS